MVFLFVYFYFSPFTYRYAIAGAIFALAGLTDIVDGYLARKFHAVSHLGKILDPLADKLMQMAVFVCLYLDHLIPLWILLLFVFKECVLLLGGALILKRGRKMESSKWYGKMATILIYAAVMPLILFHNIQSVVFYVIMIVAILWSFIALFLYILERRDAVRKK
jgi:cardiolipin synthase